MKCLIIYSAELRDGINVLDVVHLRSPLMRFVHYIFLYSLKNMVTFFGLKFRKKRYMF